MIDLIEVNKIGFVAYATNKKIRIQKFSEK